MHITRAAVITASIAAAFTAAATPPPAFAASTLDLTAQLGIAVPFPDAGTYYFEWTPVAVAERRVQVFDVETKRYVTDFVATSASNVVVRTTVPATAPVTWVRPLNGFVCGRSANVVTCTGNVPSTGYAKAAIITAVPQSITTKYTATTVVDPSNTIAELSELNNTTSCGAVATLTRTTCS
jgi:hypothetical protein